MTTRMAGWRLPVLETTRDLPDLPCRLRLFPAVRLVMRRSRLRDGFISRQHLLSDPVARAIRVLSNPAKFFLDAQARRATKIVHEMKQFGLVHARFLTLHNSFRAQARRGDGEQLGADVHEAAEQQLLAFELGAVESHGVEHSS